MMIYHFNVLFANEFDLIKDFFSAIKLKLDDIINVVLIYLYLQKIYLKINVINLKNLKTHLFEIKLIVYVRKNLG